MVPQVDERTLELQWSNSQMDQDKHCIGGYVIKLKSKNSAESNSSFYEHHDSTVSYFAVSGGGDCHGESNIFEWYNLFVTSKNETMNSPIHQITN